MAKKSEEISIREFADRIKVSEGAVRRAIREGRFTKGYDPLRKKIAVTEAFKDAWVLEQKIIKPKAGVSRAKAIEKIEAEINDINSEIVPSQKADPENLLVSFKITTDMPVQEAMRRREIIALALDKKKLEEAEAILVRRDKMEKALFVLGSELKKALLDIPARSVRDIMAASNEVEGIKIMTDELILVLNTYGALKNPALR